MGTHYIWVAVSKRGHLPKSHTSERKSRQAESALRGPCDLNETCCIDGGAHCAAYPSTLRPLLLRAPCALSKSMIIAAIFFSLDSLTARREMPPTHNYSFFPIFALARLMTGFVTNPCTVSLILSSPNQAHCYMDSNQMYLSLELNVSWRQHIYPYSVRACICPEPVSIYCPRNQSYKC
jgi:hypothetical protein